MSTVPLATRVRVLALAVQQYGADSAAAKAALEDPNYGVDPTLSLRDQARALAGYTAVKTGRVS